MSAPLTSQTLTNDVIYKCDDVALRFCLSTVKPKDLDVKK